MPHTQLARWRLGLAELDYEVSYRLGVKHRASDASSRILTDCTDQNPLRDAIPTIREGSKNESEDLDEGNLVGKVTISQGKDKKPEVMLCTAD